MRITLLSTLLLIAGALGAQTTYNGNGNTGFGGVVGPGSLQFDDDGTTVTGVFTRGPGAYNNVTVLYLDTEAGGITSTANLTDAADGGRRAVSGFDGANRSTVNFPAGFAADYAITIESGFVGLFDLVENGSHTFVTTGNLTTGANTFTFDFDFAELGSDGDFDFVGTYLNQSNAFRSDEAFGGGIAAGNPGQDPVAFTSSETFVGSPLPVGLAAFAARATRGSVAVTWTTASEIDNAGFAVERSRDGANWDELAWVAGFGESRQTLTYAYTDTQPLAGIAYYRLRQLDYDGQQTFSNVITVASAGVTAQDLELARYESEVAIFNGGDRVMNVHLFGMAGQRLAVFTLSPGVQHVIPTGSFASGIYVVSDGATALRFSVR